ncbi:MAG: hypothetical protein ACHQAY_19570 [Hyphomicrobiales bacterium]
MSFVDDRGSLGSSLVDNPFARDPTPPTLGGLLTGAQAIAYLAPSSAQPQTLAGMADDDLRGRPWGAQSLSQSLTRPASPQLPPDLDNGATLSAYDPTWRDRLATWLLGDSRPSIERYHLVKGLLGSTGLGNDGLSVVDATPLGAAFGVQ